MCSCVYVTERSPESVVKEEFDVFPGMSMAGITFGDDSASVSATFLFSTKKAIFRKGLGCTLLAEASEETVRNQKMVLADRPPYDQDTIAWPLGNILYDTIDHGVDKEKLASAVDNAFNNKSPGHPIFTHAVLVVYDGEIIAEKYADGFDKNSKLMGWSMAKSAINTFYGVMSYKDLITPLDYAGLEEWQNSEKKNIRIDHLLKATSGLKWDEAYFNPRGEFHKMFIFEDDKAAYAASLELEHPIGEFFEYSGGTTNILSRIMREKLGDDQYYRFPYEEVFYKIGMLSAIVEPDASGTFVMSSYCYATARDWARLGLLYLNDGHFNGQRILPEGWVEYSTSPSTAAKKQEYGAQIWLNYGDKDNPENVEYPGVPNEAIIFDGFEKNYVVILPSKGLVVVRLGVTHNQDFSLADLVNGVVAALPE